MAAPLHSHPEGVGQGHDAAHLAARGDHAGVRRASKISVDLDTSAFFLRFA